MSTRSTHFAAGRCDVLGFAALGIYYSVPFPLPPPDSTLDQLFGDFRGYQEHDLLRRVAARDRFSPAGGLRHSPRVSRRRCDSFLGIFTMLAAVAIQSVSLFDAAFTAEAAIIGVLMAQELGCQRLP
jgi:hypothetical protein